MESLRNREIEKKSTESRGAESDEWIFCKGEARQVGQEKRKKEEESRKKKEGRRKKKKQAE